MVAFVLAAALVSTLLRGGSGMRLEQGAPGDTGTPTAGMPPATPPPGVDTTTPLPSMDITATHEVIPDAALLQPKDLDGAQTERTRPSPLFGPPQPFAESAYPSDRLRRGERAIYAIYRRPAAPADYIPTTQILEYVALYRPGGPAELFADLEAAIERCPGVSGDQHQRRWRVIDSGLAGEYSLLIRMSCDCTPNSGNFAGTVYVAIARTEAVVVAVADIGWETGAGGDELVRMFLPAAIRRASILS